MVRNYSGSLYTVYSSLSLFNVHIHQAFNTLTAKFLEQGHRYHKLREVFSEFCCGHSESIVISPVTYAEGIYNDATSKLAKRKFMNSICHANINNLQ